LDYPGNESFRPKPLRPPASGVALWWCGLEPDDRALAALEAWLSADERARMARFGSPALARRYAAGRAALRWILGSRAGMAPGDVALERGSRGRPQWAADAAPDFNVSHTRDVALIAVAEAPAVRVGADVEHAGRRVNHVGLARKYLTRAEQASIAHLDEDDQRRAFLRLWTCKEAMSKATGDALSAPFGRIDIALEPTLRLLAGPAPYAPAAWTLAAADVPAGFLATIALWQR
jgi:4'-phosphopantetheinyl transferase